jgi:2-polyprenyl-6-methoxyphenol hydroxylase-like FAD-dependent oxidoreductase
MDKRFDAIIVGARCAGSPLAMLLARKGYRVLAVDRATFPSDTVSTHVVHPAGVTALSRWGLLDALVATGCPPIDTYAYDFGPIRLAGTPGTPNSPVAYCPRRTVLDKLLVDAAAAAGATIYEGFTVDDLLVTDGSVTGIRGRAPGATPMQLTGRVVIGADGRRSIVARAIGAPAYDERPPLEIACYTYWSGLPMAGRFETYVRDGRGFAAVPTHGDLTLVIAGWPHVEDARGKPDSEANYLAGISSVPEFAARLRQAHREARLVGAAVPNYFRKPYGPGWALVGDAGYCKDPITAQGITDAFHDAERCAAALDEFFGRGRPYEDAMADYQRARDERVRSMYEYTCGLATLEPPPPPVRQLLMAIQGNQAAMDGFARMNAGTISPAEFFAPQRQAAMTGESQAAA